MLCSIVTPAGTTFSEDVLEVIAPLPDGWIGILPRHSPFVGRLMRGNIAIRQTGRRRIAATIGGVIQVEGTTVTILTGAATVDRGLTALEEERGEELVRIEELEHEAEKHFDRVYQQMARTFRPGHGGAR